MPSRNSGKVAFDAFDIDLATGEVRRRGVKVKLQDQPFAVLALLLEKPGELVTREELRQRIWGSDTYVDFDQALNKAVKNIRAALGDSAEEPRYVETLPKRGYRFIARLKSSDEDQAGSKERSTTSGTQGSEITRAAQLDRMTYWRTRIVRIAGAVAIALLLIIALTRLKLGREREPKLKQLTTNNGENFVRSSVVSPDGRYLLYGDKIGIHLRVIATGETHTLERPKALSPEDSWYPTAWYPDQTYFVAVSERLTKDGLLPSSWTVSVLGDGTTELGDKVIAQSISPDGSLIAFTAGGIDSDQEIGIMGARGEDPRTVAVANDSESFASLQWSPDGRRLFDVRTRWLGGSNEQSKVQYAIESRRAEGGTAVPIVSYATASDFPDWRGGGSFCVLADERVIYTRSVSAVSMAGNDDTNLWEIKVKPETGEPQGRSRQLTYWPGRHLDHLSVSRDGKTFVLQKSNWQLHTYIGDVGSGARTQPLRRLTLEDSDDLPYSWTPDSRAVIFTSNRTGAYRLYKQAIDTKEGEEIATGPYVIDQAVLSPDGRWIIYNTEPQNGHPPRLMRIATSGGAPHVITETRLTAQVHCPSAPATRCITLEEREPHVFGSLDPIDGNYRELFRLPFWNGGWAVSPGGSIGILRQDSHGGRLQILSESGSLQREVKLAPWSNFSGLDWSADPDEVYTASVGPAGATILGVSLSGQIEPLWLLEGSQVAWAVAASNGQRVAVMGKSSYSNAWLLEGF